MKNVYFKYCVIIAAAALLSLDALAQSGAWQRKADLPKGGGAACVVGDKIYVVGGWETAQILDAAYTFLYDPVLDKWTQRTSMPTPRGFLSAVNVNEMVYAIGGGYPRAKTSVEAYDPLTDTWVTKANLPAPRLGARAEVIDGIVYYAGGNYNQRVFEAYNPVTDTWTAKPVIPEGGGGLSTAVFNERFYVFGGSAYSPWSPYPYVYAFDPKKNVWMKKKDMPTPRFSLQTFELKGKIYAFGGSQAEGTALGVVEAYDPVTDTWESKGSMPDKLAWFTGAVVNDKIYIIGGTGDWQNLNSKVWEYDPFFHTDVAAGEVSGTWTAAKSPYHVLGEVTIPNGKTLAIESGVKVVFMGHYKLNVQGRLLALGTKRDSVFFTAEDTTAGWHGIRFINTPAANDTSKIVFCSLTYGKANTGTGLDRYGGAVMINGYSNVVISDCLFEYNMTSGVRDSTGGPAVGIFNGSPTVTRSTFIHNDGTSGSAGAIGIGLASKAVISNNIITENTSRDGAIICCFGSDNKPTISGNIISNNTAVEAAGGIVVYDGARPRIENNLIIGNRAPYAGGIFCLTNASPLLISNTIANNSASGHGGGLYCEGNSDPVLVNNILYHNTALAGSQVFIVDTASDPVFINCDVGYGKDGFGGSGAGSYTGRYENNIDVDPAFMMSASGNYRLANNSPCIGHGTESVIVEGTWVFAPLFCIMGTPRPSPAGSDPDIGACESILSSPTSVVQEPAVPTAYVLYQNFPNPFNPSTKIQYAVPERSFVTLKVFDVLGKEIAVIVSRERNAGRYEAAFDGSGLPGGVYFYTMKAGRFSETKKFLLLR